jgi:hypothetical protein
MADTVIAARDEHSDAQRTELCKQVAHGDRISRFDRLFASETVRYADGIWDERLDEQELEQVEKRIRRGAWLEGVRPIHATGAVEDERGRVRHGRGVLDVGVRLRAGVVLVVPAAVRKHDGVGRS